VAAIRTRAARSPVDVHVPGGVLRVEWQPGAHAFLTGPAETSFERTLAL
jgi:diaminopimelate epimerase